MASESGQPNQDTAADEARLLTLLKEWHGWAATFTTAPTDVRCRRCEKLIGAIHEPDGIRLPSQVEHEP